MEIPFASGTDSTAYGRSLLELVNLLLGITQFAQHPPGTSQDLLHRRRPAHKYLADAAGHDAGAGEQLLVDVSGGVFASGGGPGDCIDDPETARVVLLHLGQLAAEDDVVVRVDAPHERDTGLVVDAPQDTPGQLVAGRDALSAGDEAAVILLVGLPRVGRDAEEGERVALLHGVEVRRLLAAGVVLHQELDVARLICDGGASQHHETKASSAWALSLGPARVSRVLSPRSFTGV